MGQKEHQGEGVNPTGMQVGKIFNVQGQAIVLNAGNVLAHPGQYAHRQQFCRQARVFK